MSLLACRLNERQEEAGRRTNFASEAGRGRPEATFSSRIGLVN